MIRYKVLFGAVYSRVSRKTQTKVMTMANDNRQQQYNEARNESEMSIAVCTLEDEQIFWTNKSSGRFGRLM